MVAMICILLPPVLLVAVRRKLKNETPGLERIKVYARGWLNYYRMASEYYSAAEPPVRSL